MTAKCRTAYLLVLLASAFSGVASAYSRVVVLSSVEVSVSLDGVPVQSTMGLRTQIQPVAAGRHTIAVLLGGEVQRSEVLDIPDGVQVTVRYSPGAPFEITGASSAGGEAADSHVHDSPTGVAPQGTPLAQSPTGGTTSQGSLGPASGPRATDILIPRGSGGGQRSVNTVAGATARGLRSMTYGAKAGTSFGGGRTFNQKIKKANVVYGSVHFIKTGGPACRIYDDGMLVVELDEGEASVSASLEVGRRPLEFRGVADHALWNQGDLKVDSTHTVQLVFDATTPPTPQARPWLWDGI